MKIQVETLSPVESKLTVEVEPERVAREFDRAYASLGRRVKLKGFRAGKVPRPVLERNFRDQVEADVLERLVSTTFEEAVRENGIEAVAPHFVARHAHGEDQRVDLDPEERQLPPLRVACPDVDEPDDDEHQAEAHRQGRVDEVEARRQRELDA